MHAHFGAWAVVRPVGTRLEVDVSVRNDRGEPLLQTVIQGDSADRLALGGGVGAEAGSYTRMDSITKVLRH